MNLFCPKLSALYAFIKSLTYETSLSDARVDSVGTNGKAQSKQGVIPTSAENSATYSWYGLYKIQDKTYAGKNGSVESSMIWGSQYDAIINWVKNVYEYIRKELLAVFTPCSYYKKSLGIT